MKPENFIITFDVANLNDGNYVVVIRSNSKSEKHKIIITR
jgi:hypothetical protein